MIFVTVGHSKYPFQRLIDALETLPSSQLDVQYGSAGAPREAARAKAFMPFDEVADRMASASVVICHAGVGSILCSLRAGRVPIVAARLREYGEAVDDHQIELASSLESAGDVLFCRDLARDLPACLEAAGVNGVRPRTPGPSALARALREDLLGALS